ncbi:VCBS repeat-containing protein [Candidatus Sumerlaeota bacterium]|nr:VCBS repeat-containing protein [Candidatus Sumerlaeota bacterium]
MGLTSTPPPSTPSLSPRFRGLARLRPNRAGFLVLAFMLSLSAGLGAGEPEESGIAFALEPPEFTKADWTSGKMASGDLNGDGRLDLVMVNNQKGILQVFRQRADSRAEPAFEKEEQVLADTIAALAVGDFNGDRRDDLVLAPIDRNVLVRFQRKDGILAPGAPLESKGLDLLSRDLDDDGVTDLAVFSPSKVDVFYGAKSESVFSQPPQSLFNGASPGSRLLTGDLDGDGGADLVYKDNNRRSRVLVRFRAGPRQWGLESAFEIADAADLAIVSGPSESSAPARLAAVDSKTREIRLYRLESSPSATERLPLDGPHVLTMESDNRSDQVSVHIADVDGDGHDDVVAVSPQKAEIALFVQNERNTMDLRAAPSLSDIVRLAALPTPKGSLVFSLSNREETIAVSVWDSDRGLSVPAFLDTDRKPLAMAVGDLDGSGKPDLLYLFNERVESASAGRSAPLRLAVFPDPSGPGLFESEPVAWSLPEDLKMEEPNDLVAADLNGDKRCDLTIFSKYAPVALLLQTENKAFESFVTDQGVKKGIFNNVRSSQIRVADLDGDGRNEMLVARQNFVRAYRIGGQGGLEMVEQFNGRNASSRIESAVLADLDGSGRREVVLLDTGGAVPALTIYARNDSGVYDLVRHEDIEGVRGVSVEAGDFNADGADDLLVCGDQLSLFYAGRATRVMKPVWKRSPEDKEGKYARIYGLHLLDPAAAPDGQLLAVESSENILEFFADDRETPGAMTPFFRFKMFDDEASVGRGRDARDKAEPREIVAVDVDGDGMKDLVALAHDNILYYRQTKPDPEKNAD